ncbi:MAG: hypothetical protein EXR40_05985 [Nitrosomonadaceae bacterium]|nr:hypothetical protein [Nitrosomonadaceae bacterium]
MSQLFKKAACFSDVHFGMRSNSRTHNDDCESFIKWFVKEAHEAGAETCIFLGDWHNNRSTINVSTLNYTVSNLEYISKNFDRVFVITGNHDLFYREKREIHSLPFGRYLANITMVDQTITEGDVTMVPWLVGDEWSGMKKLDTRYVFGHFELPSFKMNAMVEMPDHGGLNASHFPNQELVFSGHFHKRQQKGNVIYMGNCFPHNYADAWDDERGMMTLEWGGQPEYKAWPDAPRFRVLTLGSVVDDPGRMLNKNTFARIGIDIDISYEEAQFLKTTFQNEYGCRDLSLIPVKREEHAKDWHTEDIKFESVDQIVMTQLNAIESDVIDKKILIDIYNSLTV